MVGISRAETRLNSGQIAGIYLFEAGGKKPGIDADVQHARRIPDTTGMHRHLDDLLFDLRGLPRMAVVQEERATGTALLAAAVALLALRGFAVSHNIGTLAVGTMQNLDNHEATRLR